MNHNLEIELQAWLDGELSPNKAARLAKRVENSPEAQQLLAELKVVKAAMQHNELDVKVPDTREFYWSQIQRRIEQQSDLATAPVRESFFAGWRRFLVPLAGATAAVALLMVSVKQSISTTDFDETTNTSSEIEQLTFHDQAAGMTVVWLQEKDDVTPPDMIPESDIQ